MSRSASFAASVAVGAVVAGAAFGARGGSELSRATAVEIGLFAVAGAVVAAALLIARPRRPYGAVSLLLFGALAVLTGLSILWSIAPSLSWEEANRTLSYLAVFAGGLALARLAPSGYAIVLRGVLLGAAVVVGYALASRVWPASLAENEIFARIGQPYGYWNAVGVTAALAVPPALWLGARRSGNGAANALAYPLLGLVFVAIFLSYSRGALVATAIGTIVWVAIVPLRLRSLAVLAVSAAGAAPVIVWASARDAFTKDETSMAVREAVGTDFGLLLVAMVLLLTTAGLAVGFAAARRIPAPGLRRRVGVALIVSAYIAAIGGALGLAVSDRGIGGTVSDRWHDLTSETATTPGGPERLTKSSSSRARYWRQAFKVFDQRPVLGTGAGTFGNARLRHRRDQLIARHAHGYAAQTASDLGLLGLGVSALLTLVWLFSAARTLRLRPAAGLRRRVRRFDAERVGLAALALSALVFGLHSAIDWTWFVPGPAVAAMLAAGFVAGRGPVPLGEAEEPPGADDAQASAEVPAATRPGLGRWPRIGLAVGTIAAAALCAWSAWQPERADSRVSDALDLVAHGKAQEAIRAADEAHDINPLSARPLLAKATAQAAAGQTQAAGATLEEAVLDHPGESQVWLRLADFELHRLDEPKRTLETLRGAFYLDPRSEVAKALFLESRSRLRVLSAPPVEEGGTAAEPGAESEAGDLPGAGGGAVPGGDPSQSAVDRAR